MFACSSGRRRSRWRNLSRNSSAASSSVLPRATGIAGVSAGPTTCTAVAWTSTSPVASSAFFIAAGRATTSPSTTTTVSLPTACAAATTAGGAQLGPTATCTMPSRSRRSRNTIPPRSRRWCTHPPRRTSVPTCSWRSAPQRCVRWLVRLALTLGSGPLCFAQRAVELVRRACREQPCAHRLLTDETGDAADRLHVRSRLRLRPGQQEKQPHRLAVDRFVRHWLLGGPRDHHQVRHDRGLAVRHRDPVPDPGRELALPFENRPQHFFGLGAVAGQGHSYQLTQHPLFVPRSHGNADVV